MAQPPYLDELATTMSSSEIMRRMEPLRETLREAVVAAIRSVTSEHAVWDEFDRVLQEEFDKANCYLTFGEGKAHCLIVVGDSEALFDAEPEISAFDDSSHPRDLEPQISAIDDLVRRLLEAKARLVAQRGTSS